jgi:hypothetical protein
MAILGYKKIIWNHQFGMPEWLKKRGLAGWLEVATVGLDWIPFRRSG